MSNKEEFINEFKKINEMSDDTKKSISSLMSTIAELFANLPSIVAINDCTNLLSNSTNALSAALEQIKPISERIDINLYTERINKLFASIRDIQTPFSDGIKNALIKSDLNRLYSAIGDVVKSKYIANEDFAVLKKTNLLSEIGEDLYIPKGLKTSIKDLNSYSSEMLVDNKSIMYGTFENCFINTESINKVSCSSKEMNVVCSTKALFDNIEGEEFFSEEELMDFLNYLDEKTSLGLKHTVGRKIYALLDNKIDRISFDKSVYFHGRIVKDGSSPFTKSQMGVAPTGIMNPGRYNHPGQSYYYFSDTIDGCVTELGKHNKLDTVQIALLRPNNQISMIDLSGTIKHAKTLLRYIRFQKGNEPVPKAYLIPCFISDCCRDIGIEGIKFRGSNDYNNYVCWENKYLEITELITKNV